MIKANELRIGNLIWDDTRNKEKFVNHRVISDLASSAQPLSYSPIRLTPEWLERMGFEKAHDDNPDTYLTYSILKLDGGIAYVQDGWYHRITDLDGYYEQNVGVKIEYIHQFQNLYFSLTGEELEIKMGKV